MSEVSRWMPGLACSTASPADRGGSVLDGHIVVGTTSALYVWEWSHYPQYYIPVDDIDHAMLLDEQHEQKLSRGTARRYALQDGEFVRPAALLIYGDDATVEGLGAFSLGGELRSLRGVADHDATIPAYEFGSPLRGCQSG